MKPLILAGEYVETDNSIDVYSPATGKLIGSVSAADASIAERACELSVIGFNKLRRLSLRKRAEVLERLITLLDEGKDELARTISEENGKTIREAIGEVERGKETVRLALSMLFEPHGELLPLSLAPGAEERKGIAVRMPIGPVLAITPFNFPLNLALHKIAPAIAVGCSFILKPASKTPLTALFLGRLLRETGLPPEAFSILPARGETVGPVLAADRRIKCISFTGSRKVGYEVAGYAIGKNLALELGSNSGVIVMDDAPLELASQRICAGAFALAGQVCISTQRVYVHRSRFDQLCDLCVEHARKIKLGDPLLPETDMGPMISERDAERVMDWIDDAVNQGAKLLLEPERNGPFLSPFIITSVYEKSPLVREELFGPGFVIEPIDNLEEGINKLNDSVYGLQAGIFTNNIRYINRAFEELEVGGVIVNDVPTFRADLMPYGGVKGSGIGREGPRYAIEHLTYWKCLVVRP